MEMTFKQFVFLKALFLSFFFFLFFFLVVWVLGSNNLFKLVQYQVTLGCFYISNFAKICMAMLLLIPPQNQASTKIVSKSLSAHPTTF